MTTEGEKTYWFNESGIYQLKGPLKAENFGRNEGNMFLADKMVQQEDGSLIYEGSRITQAVYAKNNVTALKGAIRYFTGPDYEADLMDYFSCGLEEREKNAG